MRKFEAENIKLRRLLREERLRNLNMLERHKSDMEQKHWRRETDEAIDALNKCIRESNKWDWPGAKYGIPKLQ